MWPALVVCYGRGLTDHQHHLEMYLRYVVHKLYWESEAIVLVIIDALTAGCCLAVDRGPILAIGSPRQ